MKQLGFLLCTAIYIGLTRSECQDVSPGACALMKHNKPDLCEDPSVSITVCPKFCNKCPLSCYSCLEVDHPGDCNTVTTCQANEECLVGEVLTTDFKLKYRLGCVAKDVCTGLHLTELTGFGKRSVDRKRGLEVACCSTDKCNRVNLIHHTGSSDTTTMVTHAPTTVHITTRTTTPMRTTVITHNICQDDPMSQCDADTLTIVCADAQLARQFCPKSCGVCSSITLAPTTTVGSVCQDDPSSTCDGDTLHIICGDSQLAQQFCAKSCGVCSTKPASHVATTIHITTTTRAPLTTVAGLCQDDPSSQCDANTLPIICGDPQLARQFCAKSCGVCSAHAATTATTAATTTAATTTTAVCQDDPTSNCGVDTLSIICGDQQLAKTFCAKSCGVCTSVTTRHVATTTTPYHVCADDPNSSCQLAKDIICADQDLSTKFCRKTCGLCT